jgi:hypothetical protein
MLGVLARRLLLRRSQGQVALEVMVILGTYALAIVLFLDIVVMLGNAAVLQGELNRVALQASAQGCVPQVALDGIAANPGIGVGGDFNIEALAPNSSSYVFNRSEAETGSDATCDSGEQPGGRYIWIDLQYDQSLLMLPSVHVERTALAVSNSLDSRVVQP